MTLQLRAESKQLSKAKKPWKKVLMTGVMAVAIMSAGLTVPSVAEAKGYKHGHHHHKHHKHKHKHKHRKHKHHVVVVKPKPRPPKRKVVVVHKPPRHRYYHRSRLPEIATFAVIAGATYAIIDNHYYKRRGDKYEYVTKPR